MDKSLDRKIEEYLLNNKEQFIDDIRAVLKYESVKLPPVQDKPFGQPIADALDTMLSLCEREGLKTTNIDYYCGEAVYGDGDEIVALLTHLDIVPLGEGWTHDPLAGEVVGNLMYGRGTSDDKGPGIAALYAVAALKHLGLTTKRKIKLIFGCDEETGMGDIPYYLSKMPAPDYAFSPDASFPSIHAEKTILGATITTQITGSMIQSIVGGTRRNVVMPSCIAKIKGLTEESIEVADDIVTSYAGDILTISVKGISAHASTPETGKSAFYRMLCVLKDALPKTDAAYDKISKMATAMNMNHTGAGLNIDCEDDVTGPLTFNLGVVSVEDECIITAMDIRHPVTLNEKETIAVLIDGLSIIGWNIENIEVSKGLYLPLDHPLIKVLQDVYKDVTGLNTKPLTMGGGTYARTLPCAVAYGPGFPDDAHTAHMADEHVNIDNLLVAARIYAHAILRLGNM